MYLWTCPFCRYSGEPVRTSSISATGWVLAVVLFVLCLPLFWIPLLACKDFGTACPACRTKVT
jgi:hypothetical protein